ncbi:MAG: hypothetical protein ACXW3C_15280 [Pyrinomonadaceae bacterium]
MATSQAQIRCNEFNPKILHRDLPSELGQKHGSRIAQLDDPLSMWLSAISLGHGRNSLEGQWNPKALFDLLKVWSVQLTHGLSERILIANSSD